MGSPCELLFESHDEPLVKRLSSSAIAEVERIEQKFSRYQKDNICDNINHSNGKPVAIDQEVFSLLQFADHCFNVSEGQFDLTSGVLRKAWTFKPDSVIPSLEKIKSLLSHIGWQKIHFDEKQITVPVGMEIDFGGIGKEYAVDRVAQLIQAKAPEVSVLINLGGDLRVTLKPKTMNYWTIGVDTPHPFANEHNPTNKPHRAIKLSVGAVCTSGSTHRYLIHNGIRYAHILNPKTGWPVANAPTIVTVMADHCLTAGMLSTLAMLQGSNAEAFLDAQNFNYWCDR